MVAWTKNKISSKPDQELFLGVRLQALPGEAAAVEVHENLVAVDNVRRAMAHCGLKDPGTRP